MSPPNTENVNPSGERLYNLLPAIYRIRDSENGEQMRALLSVIEKELENLEADIDGLYDDWFIETCAEWVIPYIGDLLGVHPLHTIAGTETHSLRAYVANTIAYRRRKGTVAVLEQLARDVTGWPARAVEYFQHLGTTQHINHVRLDNLRTPDIRRTDLLELLNTPFERASHTGEVRHIRSGRGKYNIPNIGLYLWRLQPYFVHRSTARPASDPADGRYRFNPLGIDAPLFNRPETETEITHLAEEINVAGKLRRRALYNDLEDLRQSLVDNAPAPASRYLDTNPAFQVFEENSEGKLEPIPAEEILIYDLSDIPGADDWQRPPTSLTYTSNTLLDTTVDPPVPLEDSRPIRVAVDPRLGRLAFPTGITPDRVAVSFTYGFSSDIGGGPYRRRDSLSSALSREVTWQVGVGKNTTAVGVEDIFPTLAEAVDAWNAQPPGTVGVIAVLDSHTYKEDLTADHEILIPQHSQLTIVAAGWPKEEDPDKPGEFKRSTGHLTPIHLRPHLQGDIAVQGEGGSGDGGDAASSSGELNINGLLIEGELRVHPGNLGSLRLQHCTLVPGQTLDRDGLPLNPRLPSITADESNIELDVEVDRCITGPIRLANRSEGLRVTDSIILSSQRGGNARHTPVLVSGSLSDFPTLSGETLAVNVTIGEEGPHTAVLTGSPSTPAEVRDTLQDALRNAHTSSAFRKARVITVIQRLIIVPGTPETVEVTPFEDNPTAGELQLADGSERLVQGLLSEALDPFPALPSPAPQVNVTIGSEGPHTITLESVPESVAQARDELHAAIRDVSSDPAFSEALVGNVNDQLLVLPGIEGAGIQFNMSGSDRQTYHKLALKEDLPALAGDDDSEPGPPTHLERVTVFGSVHVREFGLASETIFTGPAVAERHQVGCTRFSYLPEGSHMPRRFRCQPDLALEAYAQELGKSSTVDLTDKERQFVLSHLIPTFTSARYGDPAFAQLGQRCDEEIRTGAEDGSEMGVFRHLKQPQRTANLHHALDEYLRFGLEAGIFYMT